MATAFQIILAEDYVRFRDEIKKIIAEIPNVEVIGEVGEGNELFDLLRKARPDLVLLDISMPNLRAMKATREIKSMYPGIKVVIMAMDEENEYLLHAMEAGADGLLLKQNCARELESTIQRIRQGEQYFPIKSIEKRMDGNIVKAGYFSRLTLLSIC